MEEKRSYLTVMTAFPILVRMPVRMFSNVQDLGYEIFEYNFMTNKIRKKNIGCEGGPPATVYMTSKNREMVKCPMKLK